MSTPSSLRPLTLAVAAALLGAFVVPATSYAQSGSGYGEVGAQSARARRAQRLKELGKGEESKPAEEAALYPDATRESPEAKSKGKGLKALQALQESFQKQDNAAVIAQADAIGANADSTAYEKAFAWQLAGNAAADLGDDAKAVDYFKKALDANGLDNNNHYQVMYNLAVVQFGLDRHAEALATLDRFLTETKSAKPEHQAFRAGILANSGQGDAAAEIYAEQLAKNPDDMKLRMNAVAAYQAADQFDKANALLAEAQQKGLLTEANQYRALYVGYINADKDKDALAVIDDGVAKGVIQPSPELAKDLMVLAQKAYYNGSDMDAITLYKRAAPMAADGEAWLNLAKILSDQGKAAEAKAAAQSALDKGVKEPGDARAILGQ